MEKERPIGQRLTIFLILAVVLGGMWLVGTSGINTGLTSGTLVTKTILNVDLKSEDIGPIYIGGGDPETQTLTFSFSGHDKGSDSLNLHSAGGGTVIIFEKSEFDRFVELTGCCPVTSFSPEDLVGYKILAASSGQNNMVTLHYSPLVEENVVIWSPTPNVIWGKRTWTETNIRLAIGGGKEKDRAR
ncbi:MAG: hypothetical protein HY833_01935 [Candidatus Aenigmarchaeota archaeon]|nr:hypothetical protein [Candidatus Aenigmarchaeota archaeon]